MRISAKIVISLALLLLCFGGLAQAQTASLVFTEATGREENPNNLFGTTPWTWHTIFIGTKAAGSLANNCLALEVQHSSNLTFATPTDNKGTTWHLGPTQTNDVKVYAIYYAGPVAAGITDIQFSVTGTESTDVNTHVVVWEFNNSNCILDANNTAFVTGSTTRTVTVTTSNTDIIFAAGSISDNAWTQGAGTVTVNNSYTRTNVNQYAGFWGAYKTNVASGAQSVSFTTPGNTGDVELAIAAFQQSAGGTAPSGFYIEKEQGEWYKDTTTASGGVLHTMQFPCYSGNLIVGTIANASTTWTVTDSVNGSWVTDKTGTNAIVSQIVAKHAASCSESLTLTPSAVGTDNGIDFIQVWSLVNAAASPLDTTGTAQGSATNGNLTCDTITPSASGEFVFDNCMVQGATITGTTTSGALMPVAWNTWISDNITGASKIQDDDGRGILLSGGSSAITWVYPNTATAGNPIGQWVGTSVAYKSAPLMHAPPMITATRELQTIGSVEQ